MTKQTKTMTADEYQQAENDHMGFCLACGEEAYGVEGDAEGYECEECGEAQVQGIQNALIEGNVVICD